jgi:ABC-type Fe3+/spermidine/putrescine transport system ATPase subunit
VLQIKNVYKKLGDFQLKDINLEIEKGEYFVILGPTGTGKTVILEVVAGMYKPDKGNIYHDENDLSSFYPEKREIGFVYQDYALFPHLTIRENIIFGLKIRKFSKEKIEQKLNEIVSILKIEHLLNRYSGTLSGGEQQRAAIARALITTPKILLLDEPLSALDPRTKEELQKMLKEIHEKMKTTTIHITHDFNEAYYLADRIAVMENGTIAQVGTPNEIFKKPKDTYVANFVGMENIFKGRIRDRMIKVSSNVNIEVGSDKEGDVNLAFRPEDVIISKNPGIFEYRNNFCGKITNMMNKGPLYKMDIDIGIKLTSLVPVKTIENMNVNHGDEVWVTLENSSLHIF